MKVRSTRRFFGLVVLAAILFPILPVSPVLTSLVPRSEPVVAGGEI